MQAEPAPGAPPVVLTGATGYLGRPLARALLARGRVVRALSRDREAAQRALPGVRDIEQGDLRDAAALERFILPGADVVNMAHLWSEPQAVQIEVLRALVHACRERGARRLVHVSTVAVYGRAPGDRVDEDSPCRPVIPYACDKLALEATLREEAGQGLLDYVVVRPASVFGEAGPPLGVLAGQLSQGSRVAAYLRSVLFDRRTMNLVHADNVAAAIVFLLERPLPRGATFNLSEDDRPENNFRDVELALMRGLGVPDHAWPRMPVPPFVLAMLLRLMRRNNVNPRRVFDPARLHSLGFRRPVDFTRAVEEFGRRARGEAA